MNMWRNMPWWQENTKCGVDQPCILNDEEAAVVGMIGTSMREISACPSYVFLHIKS